MAGYPTYEAMSPACRDGDEPLCYGVRGQPRPMPGDAPNPFSALIPIQCFSGSVVPHPHDNQTPQAPYLTPLKAT